MEKQNPISTPINSLTINQKLFLGTEDDEEEEQQATSKVEPFSANNTDEMKMHNLNAMVQIRKNLNSAADDLMPAITVTSVESSVVENEIEGERELAADDNYDSRQNTPSLM